MVRTDTTGELLRSAREAAGTRNVREAVRDLARHALRSHLLTAGHIAMVARAVGQGIDSSDILPTAPVRETHQGAWAGLEDALGEALQAVELAAREFAEGRALLPQAECARALEELAGMDRSLVEGWGYPRTVPASLRERIASTAMLLRRAPGGATPPAAMPDAGAEDGGILAFVASGVLLGLSEASRPSLPGVQVEARPPSR